MKSDSCEKGYSFSARLRGCHVVSSAGRGRVVVATHTLQPGALLLQERAMSAVLSPTESALSDKAEELLCHVLQSSSSQVLQSTLLLGVLALRLLRVAYCPVPDDDIRRAGALSVLKGLCVAPVLSSDLVSLAQALRITIIRLSFQELLELESRGELEEKCRRVVGSLACNIFTVTDTELNTKGIALYPTASLFNHSCSPEAVQVFPRLNVTGNVEECRILEVRVGNKVVRPGQEICLSYIDTGQPTLARQHQLYHSYHFHCRCIK